jgi:FtsZ-interacting cell division protein ZipA
LAAELRWILLGLSLPLLVGIWWWTAHRSRQAPGNPELRESTPPLDPRYADLNDEDMRPHAQPRDWGVPPFEPLNIRTAEFDQVPVLDGPILVNADPTPGLAESTDAASVETHAVSPMAHVAAIEPSPPMQPVPDVQPSPSMRSAPSLQPAAAEPGRPSTNAAELQKIVTIRVCSVGEARWSGGQLMAALEVHGLAFGRYHVFHRRHPDGRSLFCVASLVEPGTFDVAQMAQQEFRGITLFAVLPGPLPPLETMDELFGTARGLAEELSGMVQDGKGIPLSPQRAAALREDVARFQALLPRQEPGS